MQELPPDPRARTRDQGLARLRRTTRFSIAGATALAGAFAGVAAHSNPGHKAPAAAARRRVPTAAAPQVTPVQTDEAQTPAPAPPPVATPVAPVATTGAT